MSNDIVKFGIQFRFAEKIYPIEKEIKIKVKPRESVVVETNRGLEIGVIQDIFSDFVDRKEKEIIVNNVLRIANKQDMIDLQNCLSQESNLSKEIIKACRDYNAKVKIIRTDLLFNRSKIYIFYKNFDDAKSINVPALKSVSKELGQKFKIRLEFIKLGMRSDAKKFCGLGHCGRMICCSKWLDAPKQIGIKMAKEQNIPINTQKISGVCGRLQCCLSYELDLYKKGKIIDNIEKDDSSETSEYFL